MGEGLYNIGSGFLNNISIKWEKPVLDTSVPTNIPSWIFTPLYKNFNLDETSSILTKKTQTISQIPAQKTTTQTTPDFTNLFNSLVDDSMLGLGLGTLFSSGVSAAANTAGNNLLKGAYFADGMGQNVLTSVKGSAAGLGANLVGRGINSLGGNSMLSRGIGLGVATGLGTVGARLLTSGTKNLFGSASSIANAAKGLKDAKDAALAADLARKASAINPWGLGMQVVGTGLDAAFGPSKEYEGTYGDITRGMDTAYDSIQAAVGFIPGGGLIAAGAMALNKGLSNIFGSTSGMTKQDAILGSAFMPAPVKWLNMAGAKTTGGFHNQSWQNTMKVDSFMGNAFGDLGDKFDLARKEAGKTYGTFSHGAYRRALDNLNFANGAWNTVLAMADLNELQRIRSQAMASINNQRYAQNIQGGWQPTYRGKQGMKILNNATNHNIGQRLLSGAALIDNKQMILSALHGNVLLSADEIIQRLGGKPKLKVEVASNDNTWVEPTDTAVKATKQKNSHLDEKVIKGAKDFADNDKKFRKEHPILATVGDAAAVAPMAVVAVPAISAAGDALAATTAGLAATNGLIWLSNAAKAAPWFTKAWPWVDAGMTSLFGAHGISKTAKGNFTPTTALELSPLIGPANRAIKTVNLGSRWAFNKAGLLVRVSKDIIKNKGFATVLNTPWNTTKIKWKGLGNNSYIELENNGEWLKPKMMESTYHGTGRKLYDAAIEYALNNGYKGIMSGENLLSAPKTYNIWRHYPNKILLEGIGSHSNAKMVSGSPFYKEVSTEKELLDATKNNVKAYREGPIIGLMEPSLRVYLRSKAGLLVRVPKSSIKLTPKNLDVLETNPKTVRLYRATGTNGNFEASLDGGQEFAGQWFTDNPNKPLRYASMTVKRAKQAGVDNPIELQYVDIPESELNKYRASEILKGRTDIEYEPTEDFLIPLDYPRQRVSLEGFTGNYLQDVRRPLPELDMKPFIDDYGREVIPTPWKGTDLELIDLIEKNLVNVLRDYFSPLKKKQIMKAMNWGEKEYSEFLDELIRSIGNLAKGEVKGPKDGFTILALHSGEALGEGENMIGQHVMTFNRERIPDEKMASEAIIHEIGGHGKTMSINPNKPNKISEAFPRITLLMLKNQELADNILEFNGRGKFFSLFPKVSDLELYIYNNNIPKHKIENLFNLRRYFNYMTNDILERAARAYTGLLMDKLGFNKTLNIQLLERYYTPESVNRFKNAVLNYGVPVTVGGSTAATLYNTNK